MKKETEKNSRVTWAVKLLICCIGCFLLSFAASVLVDRNFYNDLYLLFRHPINYVVEIYKYWRAYVGFHSLGTLRWHRIVFLMPLMFFLCLHFTMPVKKLYQGVFKWRWLIGLGAMIFIVANRYHGDSLIMYDFFGVQNGAGTDLSLPIFGIPRSIRSDEYIVDNAMKLNSYIKGQPYGQIGIGTFINDPFAIIGLPIYKLFGIEYLYSFSWYILRVFGILVSIEFFMIISKERKLLSVACTLMLQYSSFFQWWGLPIHLIWSEAAVVCFYHFFKAKKPVYKLLLLAGTGFSALSFVKNFYPAWQVPLAYISLMLVIWAILDNLENIKTMNKIYFWLIGAAILLAGLGLGLYLLKSRSYIQSITETVYPGKRFSTGGRGFIHFFKYFPATFFAYKDTANNSEFSSCISLFPIPLITVILGMIRRKKADFLSVSLSVVFIFFTLYSWTGIPAWLAKYSLMSYSTSGRCADILGYLSIILVAVGFRGIDFSAGLFEKKEDKIDIKRIILNVLILAACILFAEYAAGVSLDHVGITYLEKSERYLILPVFFGFIFYLIIRRPSKVSYYITGVLLIIYSLYTGFYVRPVTVGLDCVYAKPLAKEIQQLEAEDPGNWISYQAWELQSYTTLCGAKTINYVNTTPNLELWHKLDPEKKYNNVYNRYAHVIFTFGEETKFELNTEDNFTLTVKPEDFKLMNIKYIISKRPVEVETDSFELDKIYEEMDIYIYKVNYSAD